MRRFYLSGQNNFGNRGCEALVRSTLELLKAEFGDVEVLVPSYRPDLDTKQWPDAEQSGCRFVRAMPYPAELKIWGRMRRALPFLKNLYLPSFRLPKDIEADIASCDAMLVIGGDNITLDYGIESLLWHVRFAQHAQRLGKTVMVWGASVGPFSSEPVIEKFVAGFLRGVDCVSVRETISRDYLSGIGVSENVSTVADGAFVMTPQPVDMTSFWPVGAEAGVLGFNVSPLITKFRPAGEAPDVLLKQVADFLTELLETTQMAVLLVPHVDPLDGTVENSDSHFMGEILKVAGRFGGRISIAPATLNAAQLKYVLSNCSYFIGARTHATIAALSTLVPTFSIAYSIKAKGLNRDLFGSDSLVLNTPDVSAESLRESFKYLVNNREDIVGKLSVSIPEWRVKARTSAHQLFQALG